MGVIADPRVEVIIRVSPALSAKTFKGPSPEPPTQ